MGQELFGQAQDIIDAMDQAVEAGASDEMTIEEMWQEIDLQCQRLSQLAAGAETDEDDEEDDEDAQELDFDDPDFAGDDELGEDEE